MLTLKGDEGMGRRLLLGFLAVLFVCGGAVILRQTHQIQVAQKLNEQAQELAVSPAVIPVQERETKPVPEPEEQSETICTLMDMNLDALRQTNDRVLGWIHIPDSPVDYPLLAVRDNNEYLRRAWDGTPNRAGCIFLECKNNRDFSDFNTLIYGHYMHNATMFGSLHSYREQQYRDTHPVIYVATDEGVRGYEVFAAYEADVISDTYRLLFTDDVKKQTALENYLANSVIESERIPTVKDHILTLSTCVGDGTYDTRWVVQGVLIEEYFETKKELRF